MRILDLRDERSRITLRARSADEVTCGKLVISIADDTTLRVDAAIDSDDGTALRVGMRVRVVLDSETYRYYDRLVGTITSLASHTRNRAAYWLVSVMIGGAFATI